MSGRLTPNEIKRIRAVPQKKVHRRSPQSKRHVARLAAAEPLPKAPADPLPDGPSSADPQGKPDDAAWSAEDKRMLLITFVGGLGANIGLGLVIGIAIAVDRLLEKNHTLEIAANWYFGILAPIAIFDLALLSRPKFRQGFLKGSGRYGVLGKRFPTMLRWMIFIVLGITLILAAGYAALTAQ